MAIQLDVGAVGIVGIAEETTPGTFVNPTKFFPIISETLQYKQTTTWRETIRGIADIIGAVPGNSEITGDITVELLSDVLPYFLRCSRNTLTMTGVSAPYTYVSTPTHSAQPIKTMSIAVLRNGQWFAYAGCVVSEIEITIDDKQPQMKFVIVGQSETTPSLTVTPTWTDASPFGAGMYNIQIPTATNIFDCDKVTLTINDNAKSEWRLKSGTTGPQYILFGKRAVTLKLDRDFTDLTEYNEFLALTASSITIQATNGANDGITFKLPAVIANTYDIGNLSGDGNLVRSTVDYNGTYDPVTGKSYEFTILSTDNAA